MSLNKATATFSFNIAGCEKDYVTFERVPEQVPRDKNNWIVYMTIEATELICQQTEATRLAMSISLEEIKITQE